MVVALLVRLLALRFQPYVTFDGTEYIGIAEALRVGKLVESLFPPGYPALVVLTRLFLADRVLAATLVSMICGVLLVIPVALLARRTLGERWAWVPTLLVALHPVLAHFSALTMSESAFVLGIYGSLALLAASRHLLSGLVLGAAFAVRPEALAIAAVLAIVAGYRATRREFRARVALAIAVGFAVIALPCWFYFHATTGVWTLTPKLSALQPPIRDVRAAEPRSAVGEYFPAIERFGLLERIRSQGPQAIRNYPGNLGGVARAVQVLWPVPLLALSAWGAFRRRRIEMVTLPYVAMLPLLGLSYQPRFALVAVPTLAILAIVPLSLVRSRVAGAGIAVLLAGGVALCAWGYLPEFTSAFDGALGPAKRAGEWIAGASDRDDGVMGRKPFVAFYAERRNTILPDDPYESILALALQRQVRYLVVEEQLVETLRPQLAPLVYDKAFLESEQRLEPVWLGGDEPGRGVAVYRLLRAGETKSGQPPKRDFGWGAR